MASLAEVRAKYPQYNDLPDDVLAEKLHQKFYSDMPREAFDAKLGGAAPAGEFGGEPDDAAEEARIAANDPGHIKGIGSKLLQGATFGLGDEALAGIKTGFGFLGDYGKQVDREREILSGYEEAHPVISALSEIVGSLPTAGGIAKAGGSLVLRSASKAAAKNAAAKASGRTVGLAEKATDVGKRIGAGGVEGALYGAAYGAGTAEGGLGERAEGALEAAPLGAAVGGAIPAVTGAIGAVARPIGKAVRGVTNPNVAATERVAGAIDADTAAGRIAEARKIGQDLGIADVSGAPAQDLLKTAARRSGERGAIAARANYSELSAVDRVKRAVSDAFNAPEGAYETAVADIRTARASDPRVAAQYDKFYNSAITPDVYGDPSDRLSIAALLRTDAGRQGLAAAKRNASNERQPWAEWFTKHVDSEGNIVAGAPAGAARSLAEDINAPDIVKATREAIPNAKALDAVRGAVQDAYYEAKKPANGSPFGTAIDNKKSKAIKTVLNDLTEQMDSVAGGAYRRARDLSGDNIRADEALEFGRKALNTDPRVIAAKMRGGKGGFTPEERHFARVGLPEAIHTALGKAGSTAQAMNAFFKSPVQKARIRAFFDTDVEFKAFEKQMLAETLKGRTNEIASRASGAPRMLADETPLDAGTAGVARTTVMFGARAGALAAITKALNRVGGLTPKVADKIGTDLMTRDPAQVKAVLARIHALERTKLSKEAKRIRTRRIITDATAGELGRAAAGPTEYRGIE